MATLSVDLYWSFRSPYSYLAAQRLLQLRDRYDLRVNVRIVRPLAVRSPDFFKDRDPRWVHYLLVDVMREAEYHNLTIGLPNPDPIAQNMDTLAIAADQPLITRLNRLGELACQTGDGLSYIARASHRIWAGEAAGHICAWTEPGELDDAAQSAGLEPDWLETEATVRAAGLDASIVENEAAQDAAGHWGVPLMVFETEPFFGQDRIDALLWRMKSRGLIER